jgi:hypothetical protein
MLTSNILSLSPSIAFRPLHTTHHSSPVTLLTHRPLLWRPCTPTPHTQPTRTSLTRRATWPCCDGAGDRNRRVRLQRRLAQLIQLTHLTPSIPRCSTPAAPPPLRARRGAETCRIRTLSGRRPVMEARSTRSHRSDRITTITVAAAMHLHRARRTAAPSEAAD